MTAKEHMAFLDAVTNKRDETCLSLRQLSRVTGVSFSCLSRFERGDGRLSPHSARLLKHWLDPIQKQPPCQCFRCMPLPNSYDARIGKLEESIRVLSSRIDSLANGLERALRMTSLHEPVDYAAPLQPHLKSMWDDLP